MYKYICSTCEQPLKHSKESEKDKEHTLGTWRCPVHGKVKAKRVKVSQTSNG